MRVAPRSRLAGWLTCFCVLSAAAHARACSDLPAGHTLWIRLTAPISTVSARRGDAVHAVLTRSLFCDNDVILPMGARIDGSVRNTHKVGWGIRHETASLELAFDRASTEAGAPITLTARVEEVENARELVHNGVIQGIRSSDTFQGRINSRLIHLPTWNPYSDPVLIAYKAIFPIFPEPEIYFPAGTDMRLRTTGDILCPPQASGLSDKAFPVIDGETAAPARQVSDLPWRVANAKQTAADLINLIFVGSEPTVRAAFHEAGWDSADPVSRRAVMKNLYALLDNSGYPREPMTTFYLDGRPEDMNWQRSLNSYDRRDHLRIWRWPAALSSGDTTADTIWLSSATHDTGAVLAVKYRGFVHHIDRDIDDERATVIRDLDFAGCVQSVTVIARPDVPTATHNAIGDPMHTDGSVAVVTLQPCRPATPSLGSAAEGRPYKSGNIAFRFVRRQILTFRNDIWRANIIYGVYDLGRMGFTALRHKPVSEPQAHPPDPDVHLARQPSPPVQSASPVAALQPTH